ncbi:ABC transporter substrate-binding protein [Parafrankia elaeagni]|uniref:ABC transporter substrate-binding protein n=1 Tax=Parafrankia elaeagni TaxID=222534 RepID=UPI000476C70C|nr:extracellular solute-binding protein [Parafrankia elaeagni]
MRNLKVTRRTAVALSIASVSAVLVSACGTADSTEEGAGELSDGPVTLSMTWWGNDTRTTNTQEIIDAFEVKHPNITIEASFTAFSEYWDKLATETAARNTPDIVQMDEKYISTYASRGALLDLSELGSTLNTDDYDPTVLDVGRVKDGLYGVPIGLNAYAVVANTDLFQQAGVEIPDDTTWTWADFNETARQISAAGGGNFYGTQAWGFEDGGIRLWARSHGDQLYDDAGNVVIRPETLTSFWQQILDLTESGAAPPPPETIEKQKGGLSASFTATNGSAMGVWWNNQLTALSKATGKEMKLLQYPEAATSGTYYFKPSMYWSASSTTEHRAEVALFLDFLLNSEEAADIQQTERGVPANERIRAYITPKLGETDQAVVEYLDRIEPGDAEPVTPPGGSAIESLVSRYTEEVLFKRTTPADAANGFLKELTTEVENAR